MSRACSMHTQTAGDYAIDRDGAGTRAHRWAAPERGSWSSSKIWNWTTPWPIPRCLASLAAMTKDVGGQIARAGGIARICCGAFNEKPLEVEVESTGQAHALGHLAVLPAVRRPDQRGMVPAQEVGTGVDYGASTVASSADSVHSSAPSHRCADTNSLHHSLARPIDSTLFRLPGIDE